jgi:hypothetical protein
MKKKMILGTVSILVGGILLAGCSSQGSHDQHDMKGMQHGQHESMNMGGMQESKKTQVHTSWNFADPKLQANKPEALTIQIYGANNKPIQDFEIQHEKKMHLIVVSQDLSFFNHIHPEFKGNGKFQITTKFPHGGKYRLIADFVPKGASKTVEMKWVDVQGKQVKPQPLIPDTNMTKTVDGKEVTLSFDKALKANQEIMMTFNFKDAKTKQPLKNLQTYLGAVGHVVILSADANNYLHVHPMDEQGMGPDAMFHTTFPHKGVYKIWGEFKHQNKVITVSYVVKVS